MSGRDAVGMLGVNADCVAGWKGGFDSGGDAGEEARLDAVRDPGGKTGGDSREIHPAQKTLSENPFRTRLMAFPVPDAPLKVGQGALITATSTPVTDCCALSLSTWNPTGILVTQKICSLLDRESRS